MPPQQGNAASARLALLDPHMVWAAGHAVMLISALLVVANTVLFRGLPVFFYKLGYVGALLSYSIVVFKSLGRPQLNAAWAQRAYVDENVQYAFLGLYWLVSRPINLTMLPFATFSLFHCLTFLRTNIFPKWIPRQPAAAAGGQARPPPQGIEAVSRYIQTWVKGHYDMAMRFVAFAELVILGRVIFSAITFRASFISPLFLAHFIRLRYHASPFTRQAIHTVSARIDAFALPKPAIAPTWIRIKQAITAWGGGRLLAAQQGAGQAQGQGAQQRRNQ